MFEYVDGKSIPQLAIIILLM